MKFKEGLSALIASSLIIYSTSSVNASQYNPSNKKESVPQKREQTHVQVFYPFIVPRKDDFFISEEDRDSLFHGKDYYVPKPVSNASFLKKSKSEHIPFYEGRHKRRRETFPADTKLDFH